VKAGTLKQDKFSKQNARESENEADHEDSSPPPKRSGKKKSEGVIIK